MIKKIGLFSFTAFVNRVKEFHGFSAPGVILGGLLVDGALNKLPRGILSQNLFDNRFNTFGVLGDAELLGEDYEDDPRFYSPGAPRAVWGGLEVRF